MFIFKLLSITVIRYKWDNFLSISNIHICQIIQSQSHMTSKQRITPEQLGFPSKIGDFNINPVTWDNFSAPYPKDTWFLAYTYWTNNYSISSKTLNGKVVRCWVIFSTSISPKSWHDRDGQSRKLLQHQYGHYLLNCVMGLQFRSIANQYGLKCSDLNEYQKFCKNLFDQKRKQYGKKQKDYDKDSRHYLDQQGQDKWQRWMKQKILEYSRKQNQFQMNLKRGMEPNNNITEKPKNINNTRTFSIKKKIQNIPKTPQRFNSSNKNNVNINRTKKSQLAPLNAVKMIENMYANQEL